MGIYEILDKKIKKNDSDDHQYKDVDGVLYIYIDVDIYIYIIAYICWRGSARQEGIQVVFIKGIKLGD